MSFRLIQTDNPSSRDSSFFWAGPADAVAVNLGRRTFDDVIDASVPTGCIRGGGPTLTWVKILGMARTIWKGSLSFGLVNVPIGVYPATQDKSIHFNQFEKGTSDRIRYKKVNERTGKEVESANIVKGFDLGGGEYVMLTDDELAAAEPERSRQIEITDFVDLDEIDPAGAFWFSSSQL